MLKRLSPLFLKLPALTAFDAIVGRITEQY